MPTLGFHVPDESDLLKKIKQKAKANHSNKISEYVRFAVERDLQQEAATPDALSTTVIIDLAARLLGELDAQELREALGGLDQPRVLQQLLLTLMQEKAHQHARRAREDKPKPLPKGA